MSVTTGIVSRVDFQLYTHSSIDQHLAIQISAQINPGNSGGPVMQNGKVVGVAFQGYSGDVAQGVAYMIPTPVINRFLRTSERPLRQICGSGDDLFKTAKPGPEEISSD